MTPSATAVLTQDPYDPILAEAPHRIGTVALVVHDLDRVSLFYQTVIGLAVLDADGGSARLGIGGTVLIELRRDADARVWSPREAGLFHTAFLLPTRADLGAWLRHVADAGIKLEGASDHVVSEAVYLSDPEGNGIEVYADRPSALWRHDKGMVVMRTDRLDLAAVMGTASARWTGMPRGGRIGHVHLQTGDLERAEGFYVETLGFEITARYPGALFLGSGGYHHQLATNVWNSRGAPVRTGPTTGLAEVQLILKTEDVLQATLARLEAAGQPLPRDGAGMQVRDPWGTTLRLTLA